MVGSGTSGSRASRTFSPPRIPFNQSWTTAVLMEHRSRKTEIGNRKTIETGNNSRGRISISGSSIPDSRFPFSGQGGRVDLERLPGGAVPRKVEGPLPAERAVLGAGVGVRREEDDAGGDREGLGERVFAPGLAERANDVLNVLVRLLAAEKKEIGRGDAELRRDAEPFFRGHGRVKPRRNAVVNDFDARGRDVEVVLEVA